MEKTVIPNFSNNENLVSEWKHFNNIISADPIDNNQLDFFLYVLNKSQTNNSPNFTKTPPERQTMGNISDFTKYGKRTEFSSNLASNPLSITNVPTVGSNNNIPGEKGAGSSVLGDKKGSLLANSQHGSKR
jgi:hypothetical protein